MQCTEGWKRIKIDLHFPEGEGVTSENFYNMIDIVVCSKGSVFT